MTDVELRKLKRADLLEILVEQGQENEALKARVEELEKKLEDREIRINNAGTIAEAAFEMNGVLEATQAAAQQYLDNIKLLSERQEKVCSEREEKTLNACAALKESVQAQCEKMKADTKKECDLMRKVAETDVEARWKELTTRMEDFCNAHEDLKNLLKASGLQK
ncbi:MAG: hypothetical protein PUJ11_01825 [Eubacteriaceae bacterium]|nr:hypothetical protein [Eubacteriaceae bacterium]